jgi:hypothetical protein
MVDTFLTKPLTKAEFTDALIKGKGRALLHLRQFGEEGLQDILLQASLHDQGYDVQVEGDRGDWMMDIIDATSAPEFYFHQVLAAFLANDIGRDFLQHIYIVGCLVRLGKASKDILYQKYDLQQQDEWNMHCLGKLLVEFDGIKGLIHAVNIAGTRVLADPTHQEANWLINYACDHHDEKEVLGALEREAAENPNVKAYIDKVLEVSGMLRGEKKYVQTPDVKPALEELLAQIEALTPDCKRIALGGLCFRFGRHATEEELLTLLDKMLRETRREQLLRYLWCFSRGKMPRLDQAVFRLAESEDETIRDAAIQALVPLCHEAVRQFAVSLLKAGKLQGIKLFTNNFQTGDYDVLFSHLRVMENRDKMHWICADIRDVCKANKSPDALACLLFAYENTHCSHCRGWVVELLLELNILPEEVKQECRYDCSPDTRAEVGK